MKNKSCPFCSTSVQDALFLESENFITVYNIAPIIPGHSMIVPKKHITGFLELNERELSEMMQLAQKTIRVLQRVFFAEGFNWTLQEGISAGQTIEHLHMHIMPRKTGDFNNPGDWYPELKRKYYDQIDSEARPKFDINELKKITAFLREISTEAD